MDDAITPVQKFYNLQVLTCYAECGAY